MKINETAIDKNQKKFLSLNEGETKIGKIYRLICMHFNDINKTDIWMQTKNPLLGNLSPMDMMKQGREDKVLKVVENLLEGNNP